VNTDLKEKETKDIHGCDGERNFNNTLIPINIILNSSIRALFLDLLTKVKQHTIIDNYEQ
jgi:hypothetical protein